MSSMNWQHIHSRWSEYQLNARRRWSRLSAQDLQAIAGERERLVAKIAERYAIAPAQAEEELAAWLAVLRDENPFR